MTTDEFVYDAPEDFGGDGDFLTEPGTYHLLIQDVKVNETQGGKPHPGCVVFELAVLAGTVEGQEDKTLKLAFFPPKLDSKDQGAFARRKQGAMFVAAGLMRPDQKGQRVAFDPRSAIDRQIVATFEKGQDEKYLDLRYSDVWHVDDPRAAKYPKSAEAIRLIPTEQRHGESYFAPLFEKKGKNDGNGSAGSTATKKPSNPPANSTAQANPTSKGEGHGDDSANLDDLFA